MIKIVKNYQFFDQKKSIFYHFFNFIKKHENVAKNRGPGSVIFCSPRGSRSLRDKALRLRKMTRFLVRFLDPFSCQKSITFFAILDPVDCGFTVDKFATKNQSIFCRKHVFSSFRNPELGGR